MTFGDGASTGSPSGTVLPPVVVARVAFTISNPNISLKAIRGGSQCRGQQGTLLLGV
jgi:hypothetical protein